MPPSAQDRPQLHPHLIAAESPEKEAILGGTAESLFFRGLPWAT